MRTNWIATHFPRSLLSNRAKTHIDGTFIKVLHEKKLVCADRVLSFGRFTMKQYKNNIFGVWFFQMTNIDKQHEIVKASLFQFVNTHITAADLSVVDEIVLNYVISILEEASEDPNFDVDGMFWFSILMPTALMTQFEIFAAQDSLK